MSRRATLIFISKRLGAMLILMVLLSFGVFSLVYMAPGTAADAYLAGESASPETVEAVKEAYHLNEPFLTQYGIWAWHAVHLDFGKSTQTTLPVTHEINARLGLSLFLGLYAYILALLLGVVPGVVAALRRRQFVDRSLVAGAMIGMSTPPFVMGILLLYLLGIVFPVFPVAGRGEGMIDSLWHLTLPALALALSVSAFLLRHTRAAMIAVLDQDYVTFARARGLSRKRILLRYAFRNALIPIITISGTVIYFLIIGAVLVEVTFSLNGIGDLLVKSAQASDLPMIQGLTLMIAILIVSVNLISDLAYVAIDPRIRFEGRSS